MWVLLGPFDGTTTGQVDFQKQKLVKPNTSYVLGRKECPLLINDKRISREHYEFIVGSHSTEDATNPAKPPVLEVVSRKKPISVFRGSEDDPETAVAPEAPGRFRLQSGDRVVVVSGISVNVTWQPLYAYTPGARGKGPISLEACAALGIKLTLTPTPEITHHLVSQYVADLATATSLISLAWLVTPEWLLEVLRLGTTPATAEGARGSLLEHTFVLPSEHMYRPAFAPALAPAQRRGALWERNEARIGMFRQCRFVCLREKATAAATLLAEAVHRAQGSVENFDVHAGAAKFRRTLARCANKLEGGARVVVVADEEAMRAAAGEALWAEYGAEAKSFALGIVGPDAVVQAVLDADVRVLFPASRGSSPEGVPNSIADEPSPPLQSQPESQPAPRKRLVRRVPSREPEAPPPLPPVAEAPLEAVAEAPPEAGTSQPAPRKRLVRRVPSREPSAAPSPAPEAPPDVPVDPLDALLKRPKRKLTRMVTNQPFITGLDDPSVVIDGPAPVPVPVPEPTPAREPGSSAPTPARPRLKRRVGVANPEDGWGSALPAPMSGIPDTVQEEPPLKKFKALFDASDPGGGMAASLAFVGSGGAGASGASGVGGMSGMSGMSGMGGMSGMSAPAESQSESQTQTQTFAPAGRRAMMAAVREEEEETQSGVGVGVPPARGQKRALEAVEEDAEMEDEESADGRAAKRRAMDDNADGGERGGAGASKPASTAAPPGAKEGAEKKAGGGAPAGRPDTDTAFLKALASTKRGKRAEDEFDREFNKLRISRPEMERRAPEQDWAVLAEFGDDSGLRGNFMTIVEMDVWKRDGDAGGERERGVGREEWAGKPNFKKFKKKVNGVARAKVDVFLVQEEDYGMGSAYWKNGKSQSQNPRYASQMESQSQSQFQAPLFDDSQESAPAPTVKESQKARAPSVLELDSDEEEEKDVKPVRKPRKAPARAASTQPKAASKPKPKPMPKATAKKANALFLDSEDEIEVVEPAVAEPQTQTLRSDGEEESPVKVVRKGRGAGTSRQPVVVVDDSDDDSDGAVFKGFRGKKARGK